MGSIYQLYSQKELKGLDDKHKKRLQAELSQHVKNDPMVRQIIKTHRNMRKHLREKLAPAYDRKK